MLHDAHTDTLNFSPLRWLGRAALVGVTTWAALKLGGQILPDGMLGRLAMPEQIGLGEAALVTAGLVLAWVSMAMQRPQTVSRPNRGLGEPRPRSRAVVARAEKAARSSREGPYTEFPATLLLDRWGER